MISRARRRETYHAFSRWRERTRLRVVRSRGVSAPGSCPSSTRRGRGYVREVKRRGVVRRRGARTVDSGQVGEGLDIPARLHLCLAGFHAAFASRRGRDPSDHQPRAGHLVVRRFGFLRGVSVAAVGRRGIRGGVRGGHRVAGKRKRARRVGDAKGGCDLGCRRARLGVVVRSSERFATSLFEHYCHHPPNDRATLTRSRRPRV